MKKLLYGASSLALIGSFAVGGGRSYAARPAAQAMIQVRLCTSTPFGVPALAHLSHGIENGVRLAENQMRHIFKNHFMKLLAPLTLDYAKSDGSGYSTDIARQNALQCLSDRTVYGMVGTLNSGAALVEEPILNKRGMLMISPANTGIPLTSFRPYAGSGGRAAEEPASYSHRLPYVTYYRTVTTDALQGPAGARYMAHTLHAKRYFLMDDKQTYGAGLAASFGKEAARLGMIRVGIGHIDPSDSASIATSTDAVTDEIVSKNPDAVYCGCDSETAITLPKRLRGKGYTKPLMGGDALQNAAWLEAGGTRGAQNDFATSVGPAVNASAARFRSAYTRTFHTALDSYDATSYDAAMITLRAMINDHMQGGMTHGSLDQRRFSVVKWVHFTNYYGATGHTTFDSNGDTTNHILTYYRSVGMNWVAAGSVKISGPGYSPTG